MITHPEKVLFPDDGITKGELAAYYEAIAPVILPHLRGRPVTMERYPAGIGSKGFWQKDVSKGFPAVARARRGPEEGRRRPSPGDHRHPIPALGDEPEHDHPARLDVAGARPRTTRISASSTSIRRRTIRRSVRAAALGLRDLLDRIGLPSWIKTSGSKGFHIVVPLDGKTPMGRVARFANAVGTLFVRLAPDRLTQEFSKADRGGRIYVDTGQERLQRHVRGRLHRPRPARRAGVGPVHVGRDRARGRGSVDVHVEKHAGPDRQGWRYLGRHAAARAIAGWPGGEATSAQSLRTSSSFFTSNTPGMSLALTPARILSASLSTAPTSVVRPCFTTMWIG